MFEAPFYNKSIRTLVIAFGSLFNNVHIQKIGTDGTTLKTIRVPLSYGPKEKFFRALTEPTGIQDGITQVKTTLPRMAFNITGINFDPSRNRNVLIRKRKNIQDVDLTQDSAFEAIPYIVNIDLNILTRHSDEGFQIFEAIAPWFAPNFNLTLKYTDLQHSLDVPIVLGPPTLDEDYQGDFEKTRSVVWTLPFTAKAWILGPQKTIGHITEVITNLYDYVVYEGLDT